MATVHWLKMLFTDVRRCFDVTSQLCKTSLFSLLFIGLLCRFTDALWLINKCTFYHTSYAEM